jgi:murein tripeptide amidase MpaA
MVEGPITYGYSVQGRPLQAFRIGTGPIARALVGGIHGGYEANTTRLVEEFFTYITASTDLIPPQITLYLVPLVNPDGAAAGTDRILGRLNANSVDLNRNWDYEWQSVATHGTQPVSGGTAPFSESETSALRDFILNHHIQAAIFYHSAMSEVYPGAGRNTSKTEELAILMAEYTGYRYAPECIPGQISTGDAINWLTTQGITAVEIELSTHTELDWKQNLAALLAFLAWDLGDN